MPNSILNIVKQSIKWGYDCFPIPFAYKNKFKVALFTALPGLFGNTNAFLRWRAFQDRQHIGLEKNQSNIRTFDAVDTIYLDQLAVSRNAEESPDYVAFSEHKDVFQTKARLIAFYLPQFHPIAENNAWWGQGFTEWTNVSKAVPQFVGHYQPRLPGELGFYDLRLPQVMQRQIELAKNYGIHGFCFHYYWFAGRRLLEKPLNDFLSSDIDFPFCVCWANENWTRRWDGHDQDVLIGQKHGEENDIEFIHDVLPILHDKRAIRIDGKPLLIIYRPSLLPNPKATASRWRDYCRNNGLGEIFLAMVQFDALDPLPFGFDAALEFPPHKLASGLPSINHQLHFANKDYAGYVLDYQHIVKRAKEIVTPNYPLFRGVFPAWDNEARKPGRGYTFAHSSPAAYKDWLEFSIAYAQKHPVANEKIVFINAWNEWAEGAYLEPDRRYGYAYLEATRKALSGHALQKKANRVLVVGHDAHPHGAQYLALNIARELQTLGIEIQIVLLGNGSLLEEYEAVANVHQLNAADPGARIALVNKVKAEGFSAAIANTTVCGLFAADLANAGIQVVSLVHELSGVIESYGLQNQARAIGKEVQSVVFANEYVCEQFMKIAPSVGNKAIIRKQGLYKRNGFRNAASMQEARSKLRVKLNLAENAKIVLGVGYADHRKGIDLFLDIAEQLIPKNENVHFVWIGHFDTTLEAGIRERAESGKLAKRVHFPGRQTDTDIFYAGADVFALTSREDPFPSVIMEAFDVAIPVIAFAGAGGFDAFMQEAEARLIEDFNCSAFADAIALYLINEPLRIKHGVIGKQLVDAQFSFRAYVFDLLKYCDINLPRVSVVVPNYNYAHLLRDRIASIRSQTIAPYEIIVLDDASSDNSLEVIKQMQAAGELHLAKNAVNSGSVFKQWQKGVALARGEYVWIAEADDLSDEHFIETALQAFADPELVMSYTESRQLNEHGEVIAEHYRDYLSDLEPKRWLSPYIKSGLDEITQVMSVKNSVPNVSAVLFRRENLLHCLNRHIAEISAHHFAGDWALYVRLLEQGKIAFNPAPLNQHRRHGNSVTSGLNKARHLQEVIQMQHAIAQRHAVSEDKQKLASQYINYLESYFNLPGEASRMDKQKADVISHS